MKLYLPNNARLQNIDGFFRRFDPTDDSLFEFSMHPKWVSVHPAALAFAACAADTVSAKGGKHSGKVEDVRSLPYLIRMKLFEHVKISPPKEIKQHEEAGRFIPIQRIATSAEIGDFIVNMIPLLHATPAEVEPIRYVVSEMARNVLEHSQTGRGAFVAAQYYKDTRVLAIGIADAGVGIRKSISRSHKAPTDLDGIRLALRPGVTGTTARLGGNEYNAGAGLFFVKSIACASRNYFVVYSGNTLFKLTPIKNSEQIVLNADSKDDKHKIVGNLPHWNGTVVGIDLAINQSIPFAQLMSLIRRAFSVDVRTSKKDRYRKPRFL
jgi:anti-sigma regulatory factor (Ser/Thr protein kinase)